MRAKFKRKGVDSRGGKKGCDMEVEELLSHW